MSTAELSTVPNQGHTCRFPVRMEKGTTGSTWPTAQFAVCVFIGIDDIIDSFHLSSKNVLFKNSCIASVSSEFATDNKALDDILNDTITK